MNTQATLLQEEKELEAKLFGTPEVPATTEETAPVETKVTKAAPAPEETEVTVEPEVQPEEVTKEVPETEDWKLRYTNLRSSRDAKLYDAQVQLAAAQSTVVNLQQQLEDLNNKAPEVPVDPFTDMFSDEEKEALGDTAIAAMKKTAMRAAEANVKDVKDKLAAEQKKSKDLAAEQAKVAANNAYQSFLGRLEAIVPNYQEIDMDLKFKEFMNTPDIDGMPRSASFHAANRVGDAATIAKHMQAYEATKNPKAAAKEALESKVTPTGDAVAASTQTETKGVPELTLAQVDAHYRKFATGGYKGKHAEYLEMEKRIDTLAASGRIRG